MWAIPDRGRPDFSGHCGSSALPLARNRGATFKIHGHYAYSPRVKHAACFVKFALGGFVVLEQHVKPGPDKIQTRFVRARGKVRS